MGRYVDSFGFSNCIFFLKKPFSFSRFWFFLLSGRVVSSLKTENREVRARGSVAERGYRAVMAENERLCNKLEHLEEIFVHQAGKSGFSKTPASSGSGGGGTPKAGDTKLLRHLKAENSAMRVRLQRLESGAPLSPKSGGAGGASGGSKSKFVNSNAGGSGQANRQQRQDSQELKAQNAQLQKRLEKYRKREMELLRALKAQQLRRSGAGSGGGRERSGSSSSSGRSAGSPLRQES